MIRARTLVSLLLPVALAQTAHACESGAAVIFGCEAAKGRKFIELCASSPVTEDGYLEYRFGTLDADGEEQSAELEFPEQREGSLARFFGATYKHKGVYTQSVRFDSGAYSYAVFTRARGEETIDAGVEVRNRDTGKTSTVSCSERPRFYIFELKGLLACDRETPAGEKCIE